MDTKQSKVTTAEYTRSYDGKYGKMYIHHISFENGDAGEYSSKKEEQNFFKVGEAVDYTIEPGNGPDYPMRIKPVYPEKKGRGYQKPNNKAFALSYAKDMAVALIGQGGEYGGTNGVLAVAQKFYEWLESDESPAS